MEKYFYNELNMYTTARYQNIYKSANHINCEAAKEHHQPYDT